MGRRDVVVVLILGLLSALGNALFRDHFGTGELALGSDPVLWGLSAKNIGVGAVSHVPPLYPFMMSLVDRIPGVSVIHAGLFLSWLCFVVTSPLVYLVSRYLSARWWAAALAALMVASDPGLVVFGLQLQPDSATTLMLLGAVPLIGLWLSKPSHTRFAALLVYAALSAVLREHGVVLAFLLAGLAGLARAGLVLRGARVVAVLVAICLAPAITGHAPAFPWHAPWTERIEMAVQGAEHEPSFNQPELRQKQVAHEQAHEDDDFLGIAEYHVWHSVWGAPTAWFWIMIGVLGMLIALPRRLWIPVFVPMMPSMTALLVYSQDRHVIVATPVAMAVVGVALSRKRLVQALAALALIGVVYRANSSWKALPNKLVQQIRVASYAQAGGLAMCELAQPGDLVGGMTFDSMVYCPLPYTALDYDVVSWRTWVLSTMSPGPGWQSMSPTIATFGESYMIWFYRPDIPRDQRPCPDSHAAYGTPYFSPKRSVAQLDPPCEP